MLDSTFSSHQISQCDLEGFKDLNLGLQLDSLNYNLKCNLNIVILMNSCLNLISMEVSILYSV
jgi:hypothetical protein